jgi:hypothetical protein
VKFFDGICEEKMRRQSFCLCFLLTTKQQQRQQDEKSEKESLALAVLDGLLGAGVEDPCVQAQDCRHEKVNFAEAEQEESFDGREATGEDALKGKLIVSLVS